MMTNHQIDNFIRRFAGSRTVFYLDNDSMSRSYSASTLCFPKNDDGKEMFVIVLQKDIFKDKKNPPDFLKALLLHEIGHIKMNHFCIKMNNSRAEYEAQIWAIKQAIKLKSYSILLFLIEIMLAWGDLIKRKKRLRYYYGAYRYFYKLMGKKNVRKWKKFFIANDI